MSMTISQNQNITQADYTAQTQTADSPKEETLDKSNSSKEKAAKYERVTKDGDTLELSAAGKTKTPISDVSLADFSESRIKQLYSRKEITKQQYDKALKNRAT